MPSCGRLCGSGLAGRRSCEPRWSRDQAERSSSARGPLADVLGRRRDGGGRRDLAGHADEFRRYEQTVSIPTAWEDARSLMLRWAVKTRIGFDVDADGSAEVVVRDGANVWLQLAIGPIAVTELIRVIAVVDRPLRYLRSLNQGRERAT